MVLRRSLYILLVMAVAGISALTGALAGGVIVYRTVQENPVRQIEPVPGIVPANSQPG